MVGQGLMAFSGYAASCSVMSLASMVNESSVVMSPLVSSANEGDSCRAMGSYSIPHPQQQVPAKCRVSSVWMWVDG